MVAEHQHPQPAAEVRVLGRHDLAERDGLRLAACEHPVDGAAAAADASGGELVADRREHRPDPLHHGVVAARRTQQTDPALDQQHPVVGRRVVPVPLLEPGALGQCEQAGVHHPQHRVLEGGVVARGVPVQPGEEAGGAVRRVAQRRGQLEEALALRGQPVVLAGRRGGQPGELRERRQVPLAHDGRDAHGEHRLAEELVDELPLVLRQRLGRRGGEPEHERLRQLVEHLLQEPAPHLEQVVALVEDQRQVADLLEPVDQRLTVGVQPVEQAPGLRPLLVDLVVGVEGGEGLVRQRGEPLLELARATARLVGQLLPAAEPLRLDRRVRAEHHRRAAAASGGVQPDQRLAGPGRQHHPGPARTGRLGVLDGVEGLALVGAQRVRRGGVLRRRLFHVANPRSWCPMGRTVRRQTLPSTDAAAGLPRRLRCRLG